jgi:beta-glucosidase
MKFFVFSVNKSYFMQCSSNRRLRRIIPGFLFVVFFQLNATFCFSQEQYPFNNPTLSVETRVNDLMGRLTLEEKASLMLYNSPAIPRLGIPSYNWWNECLHGIARNGIATVFPQAIGLAATFDTALIRQVASAISDEARAKYYAARKEGSSGQYAGLSFWTPNINIFRDPRWGRGQETYGEDPFLTGMLGLSFVRGLQGNDPKYLKAAACAKHFAVHSGPEPDRHTFNAIVDGKDLRETYLPAFKTLVDGHVEAVMCAYNRVNDEPCCGSNTLLHNILRNEWHFSGHVVSDCWALDDIWARHKVVETREEACAMAMKAGVNLNCGYIYQYIPAAVKQGLITEADVDEQLSVLLTTRFRLGLFDPDSLVPWSHISTDVINSPGNRALAREAAGKSIILARNHNHTLPLKKDIHTLFITGPNAADAGVLLGNYNGLSDNLVTILEGVMNKVSNSTKVEYIKGTDLVKPVYDGWSLASEYEATIAVMGISPLLEGEEGDAQLSEARGDRKTIELPENQLEYIKRLRGDHKKPLILVITGGGPVTLTGVDTLADAILYVGYPGEEGGSAVADVLFGDINPAGRFPVTVVKSTSDLPPFTDYSMKNRTYRYYQGEPEFPFGFGLSFTTFSYAGIQTNQESFHRDGIIRISFNVKNTGNVDGDEVVQLYVRKIDPDENDPVESLKGFSRRFIRKGESATVDFLMPATELQSWNPSLNSWELRPGDYEIMIGASSKDIRLKKIIHIK